VADDLEPPLRGEPLFDASGNITIRFAEFLSGVGVEVNSLVAVSEASFNISLGAQLADLQQQVGSGDALTSDETGFTVDLDTLSVDMTEA